MGLFAKKWESHHTKEYSLLKKLRSPSTKNRSSGLEVINLEFILKLKIKYNDWLLADMCLQVANHCALF